MGVGQKESQDLYSRQQDRRQEDMRRLIGLIDGYTHRVTQSDINYVLELKGSEDSEVRDLAYRASDAIGIS